jgi:hypothetical protein
VTEEVGAQCVQVRVLGGVNDHVEERREVHAVLLGHHLLDLLGRLVASLLWLLQIANHVNENPESYVHIDWLSLVEVDEALAHDELQQVGHVLLWVLYHDDGVVVDQQEWNNRLLYIIINQINILLKHHTLKEHQQS